MPYEMPCPVADYYDPDDGPTATFAEDPPDAVLSVASSLLEAGVDTSFCASCGAPIGFVLVEVPDRYDSGTERVTWVTPWLVVDRSGAPAAVCEDCSEGAVETERSPMATPLSASTPGQRNATTRDDVPPVGALTGRWVIYTGSVVDMHGLAWQPYPQENGLCSACDISDPELEGRSCLAGLGWTGGSWYWLHGAHPESFTPAPKEN